MASDSDMLNVLSGLVGEVAVSANEKLFCCTGIFNVSHFDNVTMNRLL